MLQPRRFSTLLLVAALFGISACDSDDPGEEENAISIEGTWESQNIIATTYETGEYAIVQLDFETDGSDVSGSGAFEFYNDDGVMETDLSLDGTYDEVDLSVTATAENPDMRGLFLDYECTVQSRRTLECDLFSDGVSGPTNVRFMRQQ